MNFIILPAYNEESSLGPLLTRIRETMAEAKLEYRVLVVNDGSSDGTAGVATQFAAGMPLELIDRDRNGGLAEAMRTGFDAALARCSERDIVIVMDADDTHNPGLIVAMVRMIREGNDVVIASRFVPGGRVIGVPWDRRLLSVAGSLLCRLLFPITNVRDYTCGYRAYRGGILLQARDRFGDRFIEERGFSCMVDILLKLRQLGAIMNEAPLILRYDFKRGFSKMDVGKTVRSTLALLWRRWWAGR